MRQRRARRHSNPRTQDLTCVHTSACDSRSDDPAEPERAWWARGAIDQCDADRAVQQLRKAYFEVRVRTPPHLPSLIFSLILRSSVSASSTLRVRLYISDLACPPVLQPFPCLSSHDAPRARTRALCCQCLAHNGERRIKPVRPFHLFLSDHHITLLCDSVRLHACLPV